MLAFGRNCHIGGVKLSIDEGSVTGLSASMIVFTIGEILTVPSEYALIDAATRRFRSNVRVLLRKSFKCCVES